MASCLLFTVLLCGLLVAANAKCASRSGSSCEACPHGWTYYGGQCYLFEKTQKDWGDAERSCNSLDGNLASIQSSAQFAFLRDLIVKTSGSNSRTWVGGSDAAKDGVWLWSDGTKFVFNAWANGEPNNNGGRESCMEMNFREKEVNDERCQNKRPFVCVRDP